MDNNKNESEDFLCVTCGTDLKKWLIDSAKHKVYMIDNGDFFCSKKCYKKYCLDYFELTEINQI